MNALAPSSPPLPSPAPDSTPAIATRPGLPCPGDVVAGKYCIEKVVAEGGMGVVYAAHHIALDQRVALKVLLFDAIEAHELVERFVREARAAARLRSEHVVRVTDAGALDGGAPFLVMEYLQGCDLAELLRLEGPVSSADVADYTLQVLAALAQAHAAGIVHRDLKPANLFLAVREDGSNILKVLDFGISKQTSQKAQWKELTGKAVLGTPCYMSPEQLRSSKSVDARADIWSLGVVFYELLSGRLPFDGEGPGAIFSAILVSNPTPLADLCPQLPRAWTDIVARCLERAASARYQNVAELARAVAPLGSGRWAHLLEAIESAHLPQPNVTLMAAAVAAAMTSLPPPTHPEAVLAAGTHRATFMTGKTLQAEVVSTDQREPPRRRSIGARAPIAAAMGAVLLVVLAASARHLAHGAPALAARTAGEVSAAIATPHDEPKTPQSGSLSVAPPPVGEPVAVESPAADASPAPASSAAAPALSARPPRRAIPSAPKSRSVPERPTFLKSWR